MTYTLDGVALTQSGKWDLSINEVNGTPVDDAVIGAPASYPAWTVPHVTLQGSVEPSEFENLRTVLRSGGTLRNAAGCTLAVSCGFLLAAPDKTSVEYIMPTEGAALDWSCSGTCGAISYTPTAKWANGGLEAGETGWRVHGPGTGRTNAFAHTGSWSHGHANHRSYTFAGQTFTSGVEYIFVLWQRATSSDVSPSTLQGWRVGHSLVAFDNHWTAGDWEDLQERDWEVPPGEVGVWVKRCGTWTPTSTWTDDVRIDFHLSGYIDDAEVGIVVP